MFLWLQCLGRFDPGKNYLESTNALGLQGHYLPSSDTFTPIAESEVTDPNDMMALGDSFDGGVFFWRWDLSDFEKSGKASSRHQGKANVVFCDGHIESPSLHFFICRHQRRRLEPLKPRPPTPP